MFQSFSDTASPEHGPDRLMALRAALPAAGITGFLIPRADRHQGEYVADRDARLAWLTGFTGSAGFACVLPHIAGVFVDSRYRLQIREQVANCFTPVDWPETHLGDWLRDHAPAGTVLGFDPWLHTIAEIETLTTKLAGSGITLMPVANQVDLIWDDRPDAPQGRVKAHPIEVSGKSSLDKIDEICATIADAGAEAAILTLPDSICWLLNIRGDDIPRVPIVQAYAIIHAAGRVSLFSNTEKFLALGHDPIIDLAPWDAFDAAALALTGPVIVEKSSAPQAVATLLGDHLLAGADPCALPKARKNDTELAGSRAAHRRDGAAMARFLHWFHSTDLTHKTEIDMVKRLEKERRASNALEDISFETISGAGPNGAIVHYRVSDDSNRLLDQNSTFLLDSGGQYLDGTTDITRTMAVGTPSDEMRNCFTRVLQGMIAISRLRFPRGVTGADIDVLARAALWRVGLDYGHGTGHGVGSYLSVHEGPQSISRSARGRVALEPGMILSNEPGYYKEGFFGIRIENLIAVKECADFPGFLEFETLTFTPIDRALIEPALMQDDELEWLNKYHAAVLGRIGPDLSGKPIAWLETACAPIRK